MPTSTSPPGPIPLDPPLVKGEEKRRVGGHPQTLGRRFPPAPPHGLSSPSMGEGLRRGCDASKRSQSSFAPLHAPWPHTCHCRAGRAQRNPPPRPCHSRGGGNPDVGWVERMRNPPSSSRRECKFGNLTCPSYRPPCVGSQTRQSPEYEQTSSGIVYRFRGNAARLKQR